MSKSKQKGTLAETAVADYFRQTFPAVERRALSGSNDKGDIANVPNAVIEIKNQKSYKIPEWIKETEQERINAGSPYGVLVIKPNKVGITKIDQWWAVMPLEQIVSLLVEFEKLQSQQSASNTNLS